MSELWQPGGNSTEQCTHSEPPGPKYTIGANLQSLFFGKSKAKGQKFMFIVYVQSNQAIGSRSGGWSSSQILLKSISLGFTSSSSLLFSLLSNWFSFLSEPSFLPLSVSRILRGGGTYPSFGRWTTRKPRNEISTKPGHSPTSNSPKGFLYYLHGHGWPALLQLLKMVSHTLNTDPAQYDAQSPVVWDLLAELFMATTWETNETMLWCVRNVTHTWW